MPQLSSLLKTSKKESKEQIEPPISSGSATGVNIGTAEKVQRRHSKRDFFRNLLSGATFPRTSGRRSKNAKDSTSGSPTKPAPPMFDPNKPLPRPPSTAPELEQSINTFKLDRIISPITIPDIHKLFSGAPHFFVRSEGLYSGPPKPSVAFPWNTELEIRDLSDHSQIEDQAWGCVTAIPHITRDPENKGAIRQHAERQSAHYIPPCYERPNMLSMQGLERGTIGFSAALELGVADVLLEEQQSAIPPAVVPLSERRVNFLNDNKHGVRPLAESNVVTKLIEIGTSYNEDVSLHKKLSVEMYTELFTQVLYPPTRVTDSDDPYSLHVQIQALIDALATPDIWFDFTLVEWRIKLGQILWGPPYEPDIGDETSINGENVHGPGEQKFWLLLQILLACELLIRLDIVTNKAEHGPNVITVEEIRRFDQEVNSSVRWSMILARCWLENIQIESVQSITVAESKKPSSGWLAAITGIVTPDGVKDNPTTLISYMGKHQARQMSGLIHFARKLHWPQIEDLIKKLSLNHTNIALSGESTPASGTPLSMVAQRPSYFGPTARPVVRRGLSKERISSTVQPSGWLSNSYLTGLVLPGEGLSHFLISTLLENDKNAVAQLGEEANLYGGFIYSTKSFWSTSCIVGRVLAAGRSASECMGWLSSDILPAGLEEGWVNVEVEPPPQDEGHPSQMKPRIWMKQTVERDGNVLGDGDINSVLPGDFTLPVHNIQDTEKLEVKLESLKLVATSDSTKKETFSESNDTGKVSLDSENLDISIIKNCSATMKFVVTPGERNMELTFNLKYDVHFVTAHPCVPSHHAALLKSPTSPALRIPTPPPYSDCSTLGPHKLFIGHPLHKSFSYKREVFSHILIPSQYLSNSASKDTPLASIHTPNQEVFVIDCAEPNPQSIMDAHPISTSGIPRKRHWGSDLEMLARAWCAERGYNALISRRGRNCIACSIREARALRWKVVLRFG